MNVSVEHIAVAARDAVALKDWYMRVLGATLQCSSERGPDAFLLRVPGSIMIEIYSGSFSLPQVSNNKLNGWRHVALRVDSLASAKSALQSRGVEFAEETQPASGGGTALYCRDPEGNLLHLVERPRDWDGV